MPVVSQLERERAYDSLIRLLLGGGFGPGQPLSERGLAKQLGIGRTPVREALRDLERCGLVEVLPARGTFVKRPSLADLQEIYEIRYALEGMAAFSAAKRGATPELLEYKKKFEKLARNPETTSAAEIDELGTQFHLKIIEATGNKTLLKLFKQFRLPFLLEGGLVSASRVTVVQQLVDEHMRILNAIVAGDASKAQQLMCEHLTTGWRMRLAMYNSLDEFEPIAMAEID
jgi:DNA-binding GntR family transcriptional regulator